MNSPMTSLPQQKAAYLAHFSQRVLAGTDQASQIDPMAAGQTRAPACNSIRYPSPFGWSGRVPFGPPVFLSLSTLPACAEAFQRRELADGPAEAGFALPFPRGKRQAWSEAILSRGQDQCVKPHSLSLPVSRRFRSRPVATRWANRRSMALAQGRQPQPCLTATSRPVRSLGRGQTCSIAARIRVNATDLISTALPGPFTETKPSAPRGVRWLFCCQMSAGSPAGPEPEGT